MDSFSKTYPTLEILRIFIVGFALLLLTIYLYWQLGASSAYFRRNDMYVGRFPIGVSLYLLMLSIGLIILFISIFATEENSWNLESLMGLALTVVLTVGLPIYGVFATFFYELNWNSTEVINKSIFIGRNKRRHFDFNDIIDVVVDGNRTKITFKDGSHLNINRSMAGEKELLEAIDPFHAR